MYNRKTLLQAMSELNKAKAPKKPKDIKVDPMGYWNPDNHGKPVRIPSNNITMEGINKPLLGIANTGEKKIMQPNENYNFRGAHYVDEYPVQAKKGGERKKRRTKSLSGTNELMQTHPLLRNYKNKIYDPNAQYFQKGGPSAEVKDIESKPAQESPSLEELRSDFINELKNVSYKDFEDYIENLSPEQKDAYESDIQDEKIRRNEEFHKKINESGLLSGPSTPEHKDYEKEKFNEFYNRNFPQNNNTNLSENIQLVKNLAPKDTEYDTTDDVNSIDVTTKKSLGPLEFSVNSALTDDPELDKVGKINNQKLNYSKQNDISDYIETSKSTDASLENTDDQQTLNFNRKSQTKFPKTKDEKEYTLDKEIDLNISNTKNELSNINPTVNAFLKRNNISLSAENDFSKFKKENEFEETEGNEDGKLYTNFEPSIDLNIDHPKKSQFGVKTKFLKDDNGNFYPRIGLSHSSVNDKTIEYLNDDGEQIRDPKINKLRTFLNTDFDTRNFPENLEGSLNAGVNYKRNLFDVGADYQNRFLYAKQEPTEEDRNSFNLEKEHSGKIYGNLNIPLNASKTLMLNAQGSNALSKDSYWNPRGSVGLTYSNDKSPFSFSVNHNIEKGSRPSGDFKIAYRLRQEGGQHIDAYLTEKEIEEYRRGGYIVEDISVPELTKAQKGLIKKEPFVKVPLPIEKSKSETTQRIATPAITAARDVNTLNAREAELKQYYLNKGRQAIAKNIKTINANKNIPKKVKQELFDKAYSDLNDPKTASELGYIMTSQEQHSVKGMSDEEWNKHHGLGAKAESIIQHPLDAISYSLSGRGIENMPANYGEFADMGYTPDFIQRNNVTKAIDFATRFHPTTALLHLGNDTYNTAKSVDKAIQTGDSEDWQNAGVNTFWTALDILPVSKLAPKILNSNLGQKTKDLYNATKQNVINPLLENKFVQTTTDIFTPKLRQKFAPEIKKLSDARLDKMKTGYKLNDEIYTIENKILKLKDKLISSKLKDPITVAQYREKSYIEREIRNLEQILKDYNPNIAENSITLYEKNPYLKGNTYKEKLDPEDVIDGDVNSIIDFRTGKKVSIDIKSPANAKVFAVEAGKPIDYNTTAFGDITSNPQYPITQESNIQFVTEQLPGAKPFGSSTFHRLGVVHASHDIDVAMTQADWDKVSNKFKITDGQQAKYGHTISLGEQFGKQGNIDVNIIRENPKTKMADGQFAQEIFRQFFPDEFYKASEEQIKKSLKNPKERELLVNINKTPQELLDAYDPEIKSVLDAYEISAANASHKDKQVNRIDYILETAKDLDKVEKAQKLFAKSLGGSKADLGYQFPENAFEDVATNISTLSKIGLLDTGHNIYSIASDPKRMQLFLNDYYINKAIKTREVDITNDNIKNFDHVLSAYLDWKGFGAKLMGMGTNSVELGAPSHETHEGAVSGFIYHNLHQGKTFSNPIEYIEHIDKQTSGTRNFNDEEKTLIQEIAQKNGLIISSDFTLMGDLLDRERYKEITSEYHKIDKHLDKEYNTSFIKKVNSFYKDLGKAIGAKSIQRGAYSNSKYTTLLNNFDKELDALTLSLKKHIPDVKSRKERFDKLKWITSGQAQSRWNSTLMGLNYFKLKYYLEGGIEHLNNKVKLIDEERNIIRQKNNELVDKYALEKGYTQKKEHLEQKRNILNKEAEDLLKQIRDLESRLRKVEDLRPVVIGLLGAGTAIGGIASVINSEQEKNKKRREAFIRSIKQDNFNSNSNEQKNSIKNKSNILDYNPFRKIPWHKAFGRPVYHGAFQKKEGGYVDVELSEDEIDDYIKKGYVVEDLSRMQEGGQLPYQVWQEKTGTPWAEAKKQGLTDGSAQQNIALMNKLISGQQTTPVNNQPKAFDFERYDKIVNQQVKAGATLDDLVASNMGTRSGLMKRFPQLFSASNSQSREVNKLAIPQTRKTVASTVDSVVNKPSIQVTPKLTPIGDSSPADYRNRALINPNINLSSIRQQRVDTPAANVSVATPVVNTKLSQPIKADSVVKAPVKPIVKSFDKSKIKAEEKLRQKETEDVVNAIREGLTPDTLRKAQQLTQSKIPYANQVKKQLPKKNETIVNKPEMDSSVINMLNPGKEIFPINKKQVKEKEIIPKQTKDVNRVVKEDPEYKNIKKMTDYLNKFDESLQNLYYDYTNPHHNDKEREKATEVFKNKIARRNKIINTINSMKRDYAGSFDSWVDDSAPAWMKKPFQKEELSDQPEYTSYKLPTFETYREKEEKDNEKYKTTKRFDDLSPNSKGTRWSFRYSASNDDPMKVQLYGTRGERKNSKVDIKAKGTVMHFLDQSPLTGYIHPETKNYYKNLKPDGYVGKLEKLKDGNFAVKYVPKKDIPEKDLFKNTFMVRQEKFDKIDFNKKVNDNNFSGHTYWTKKGTNKPTIPISSGKDENVYDYSSGQSVVFIFPYKNKTRYVHFAGSPSAIKKEGEAIKKEYKLKENTLTVGLADAGSYSSSIKGNITNDRLNDWNYGYANYNSFTGAGMALID